MKTDDLMNYKISGENHNEWIIENWDRISETEYSSEYIINGHKWKTILYTNDDPEFISLYLRNLDNLNDSSSHICVNFSFALRNYKDYSYNK
eukprot:jgi/Orpsp1_1/1180528/evm.model.c7180000073797.1